MMCVCTSRVPGAVSSSLLLAWTFATLLPLAYISALPGLRYLDPFGTQPFASPQTGAFAISDYLQTSSANGVLAAVTAPFIGYAWSNPIAHRARCSRLLLLASCMLTAGWFFTIALPADFASRFAHHAAAGLLMVGALAYSVAIVVLVRFSSVLWVWIVLLVCADAATVYCALILRGSMLYPEYAATALALSLPPLANTLGVLNEPAVAAAASWPYSGYHGQTTI